jgi:streptogramin lyase
VLYQAVTGKPLDVGTVLRGGPPPSASSVLPDLPAAVDDVFRRALAADPGDRQPSARAVVDELATAFTAASPRRSSRRRLLVAGAAVAVVAVAIISAVVPGADTAERPPAPVVERDSIVGEPIAVGNDPADIEAATDSVWVSSPDGFLTRIDPRTGGTRRIQVGGQPGQIVVTDEAVWVRNLGDRITRVDTATETVSEPIPGGGGRVSGMAVGAGLVWLTHSADNTVTRIDTTTRQPVGEAIGVGGGPRTMEFDGGTVFVLNADDSSVTRIDAATGTTIGEPLQLAEGLGGVEVDDGTVYVAAGDGVTPVAQDTFVAGEPYDLQGWSYFEVADGNMWVVHDTANEVRRVDLATREPRGDPVTGIGSDVGRARFAFGVLWLTLPTSGTVVRIAPAH